jgi:acyl dehydratase
MPDEDGLDYVPEHLSAEAKRTLVALTRESEPEPAPLEVGEYLIRHWCETLEDGNPLYLDAEYARSRGFRGVVAPPGSIMTTFTMPFRWPWPPGAREPARHIHYAIKELLDLPVGIITTVDVETGVPLQVGDRVSVSQRLVSISPWKRTRLGEGHFWTMDRLYRNQRGELVARERMTAFGYGRGGAGAAGGEPADATAAAGPGGGSPGSAAGDSPGSAAGDSPGSAAGGAPGSATGTAAPGSAVGTAAPRAGEGWSPAVEEAIAGERTGYRPPAYRDRFWEDVAEGEELPALVMPITVTRCVYLASATRDFSPQHSNRDYAQRRSKTRDVFVNTPFNLGMISRFLTDWGGPRSTVRRVRMAMRDNVCAGDDMILTGRVTRKYVADGEHRADLEIVIATQAGPVTPCTATLALPARS